MTTIKIDDKEYDFDKLSDEEKHNSFPCSFATKSYNACKPKLLPIKLPV
jgi:hypothetical protein